MTLHADATAVLTDWSPGDDQQAQLRLLFLTHLGDQPTAMWRECHPDHLTASCLVVSPDGEQVVLTRHPKAGLWLQTGGHCEPDDPTLASAALREATEESGLTDLVIDPIPLRLSRHEVPFCGRQTTLPEEAARNEQPSGRTHHLDVQFMAVTSSTGLVRSPESDDLAWWPSGDPPDPTDQDVRDLIAAARRRLRGTPWPARPADNG